MTAKQIFMAATFWTIWNVRNDRVWRDGRWTVDGVCRQVQGLFDNWREAFRLPNAMIPNNISSNWFHPPPGVFKCNIDAAIFESDAGFGAVVRDHLGLFVAAKSDRLVHVRDPLVAETLAAKEALSWLKDLGHSNVILEDIRNVSVRHIKRSANYVAHALARATCSSSWSLLPPDSKQIFMAATFWTIWNVRNDRVWRDGRWTVDGVCRQVQGLFDNWREAFRLPNAMIPNNISSNWFHPPPGVFKCNIDAAIFESDAGFGAVVRDHLGLFVAAKSDRLVHVRDPLVAETLAAKEALSWLKDLGHSNVILQSDCLNFCLAFNSRFNDLSYICSIVKQCRIIARDIENVSVRHIKRSANYVAHALARATCSSSVQGSWSLLPPDCIARLLSS
nr:uncharacterized protein LOC109173080 [Ipomoea batatas]